MLLRTILSACPFLTLLGLPSAFAGQPCPTPFAELVASASVVFAAQVVALDPPGYPSFQPHTARLLVTRSFRGGVPERSYVHLYSDGTIPAPTFLVDSVYLYAEDVAPEPGQSLLVTICSVQPLSVSPSEPVLPFPDWPPPPY